MTETFAVLGLLVFWYVMGLVGYFLGMYLDLRRGVQVLMEPADRVLGDVEVLVSLISRHAELQA